MNISEVKIRRLYNEGRMKALVSVTLDNDFAIHDIKVIEGPERVFIAMPSRREENGTFRDIVHPISRNAREELEELVLNAYNKAKETEAKQNAFVEI